LIKHIVEITGESAGARRTAVGWGTALQFGRSRWCHWNFSLT